MLVERKRCSEEKINGYGRGAGWMSLLLALGLVVPWAACGKKQGGVGSGSSGEQGSAGASSHRSGSVTRSAGRVAHPRGRTVSGPGLSGYEQAYSFFVNRVSAYPYRGETLIVDGSGPWFAKFVDGSWKNPWAIGQRVRIFSQDGKPGEQRAVSLVSGLAGTLVLPYWSGGKEAHLDVELVNWAKGQYVTVMVNGKTLRSAPVPQGISHVVADVPASLVKVGDNLVRFVFRKSQVVSGTRAVSGILSGMGRRRAVGAVRSAAGFIQVAWGPKVGFQSSPSPVSFRDGVLSLSAQGRLDYYLSIPKEGARLSLSVRGDAPSKLRIFAQSDGAGRTELTHVDVGGARSSLTADLSAYAGKALRLGFAAGDKPVRILDASLYTKKRQPVTWTHKPVEYVFIWVADTLRRDAVHCLGGKDVKTPNFDAFCKKALVFTQATAPGNHSMPSHASFISGLYPPVHGFVRAKRRMPQNVPFIYELFKKAGWISALFSSNGYVSDHWGFARGLDKYTNFIRENKANASKYLWGAAKRWLKGRLGKKVFAYLATIDPHVTYDPPTSMLKLYYPEPYSGPVPRRVTGFYLEKIIRGVIKIDDPKDRRYLKSLYLGEVTYNDEWFGHFLSDLKKMGIADKSVVFLVADHGDQFWEHGSVGHGKHLYEEEIAIPLMVWWPGLQDNPPRFTWDAEAIDILPTALALAGLSQDPRAQGASLLRLARMTHVPAMLSAFSYNDRRSRSVRVGRYKLIIHTPSRPRLFDLEKDPREQKDIHASAPVALRLVRTVFSLQNAYLDSWKKSIFGEASNLMEGFWSKGPGALGTTAGRGPGTQAR